MSSPTIAGLTTGTWTIDPSHTEAGFTVRHAMIGKTRGRFGGVEGTLTIADDPLASNAQATIQMDSVDTRDENRDTHLRSADFFDVDNHPVMTFTSTSVRPADDGGDYIVDGDLTVKGVTRQVSLEVEVGGVATDPFGNVRVGLSAQTEISRKDFGLTWNAALETGGVLVGDNVKVHLEVEAIQQQG